jgi:hypothetical protein
VLLCTNRGLVFMSYNITSDILIIWPFVCMVYQFWQELVMKKSGGCLAHYFLLCVCRYMLVYIVSIIYMYWLWEIIHAFVGRWNKIVGSRRDTVVGGKHQIDDGVYFLVSSEFPLYQKLQWLCVEFVSFLQVIFSFRIVCAEHVQLVYMINKKWPWSTN